MTDLVLYILWRHTLLRERYPQGFPRPWSADNHAMEDAAFHCNYYLSWGMLAVVLSAIGSTLWPWALLGLAVLPGLAIHALWRECITDGHVARIRAGTEKHEELLDFKADLITRHAGLIVPAICAVAVIIVELVRRAI